MTTVLSGRPFGEVGGVKLAPDEVGVRRVPSTPRGKYVSLSASPRIELSPTLSRVPMRLRAALEPWCALGVGVASAGKHSSGAKKAGLPAVLRSALSSSPWHTWSRWSSSSEQRMSASLTCDTPKSEILTVEWSSVQSRLAGLMSRWMMPW